MNDILKSAKEAKRDNATALDAVAAAWVARLDRDDVSPEDEAELERWIGDDPRRAGAFARAMAANAYFDRAAALGEHYEPPVRRFGDAIDRRKLIGGGLGAMAASVIAAVGVRAYLRAGHIRTEKGGLRRAALPDGSAITLNTATDVAVDFGETMRRVRLLSGEAIFDVARDPVRPFIVASGAVTVRAIGTSFIVRLLDTGGTLVTVREGIVDVARGTHAAMRLVIGDQAHIAPGGTLEQRHLSVAETRRIEAWREGQIDLTGLDLGEAAIAFGRYSNTRIAVDSAIASRKVAGVYSTSDPRGFARDAAMGLGLSVTEFDGVIHLSPLNS